MRVKPAGGPGSLVGRVDGVKYSNSWSGTSGGWWDYPTWHQSAMFRQSNDAIRNLSDTYDGLSPATQAAWQAVGTDYSPYELCLLWEFFGPYYIP